MTTESDEELLDAYFTGDANAYHRFYKRHAGRVIGYGLAKGLSYEITAEVCQEAFLKLHRSIHQYQAGRPALPWFFTIVHHCVMDVLTQKRQSMQLESEVLNQQAVGNYSGIHQDETALTKLAHLSHEQESIVQMRAIEQLSFREIATITGKNEASLRKIFERAKGKLRKLIGEDNQHDR